MALWEVLDRLRERPKAEKISIAFAIAVAVMAILLIGWAISFFRSVRDSNMDIRPPAGLGETLDLETVNDARQQLLRNYDESGPRGTAY